MAGQLYRLTATIPAGGFMSNAITPAGNFVVGLILPPAWTNARVTIQVSADGTSYHDMYSFYDVSSTSLAEFKFNVTPGAIVSIDPERMLMAQAIRFRSGTGDEPIAQEAARTFTVITVQRITMQDAASPESV